MTNTYSKSYTEVLNILSYFHKEEYNKLIFYAKRRLKKPSFYFTVFELLF